MSQSHVLILDYSPPNTKIDFGGAQKYAHVLISDLIREGFRVTYCANQHTYNLAFWRQLAEIGAEIEPIDFDAAASADVVKQLDKVLVSQKPTIIHVNFGAGAVRAALTGSSTLQRGPWKRIFTMHGPLGSATFPSQKRWKDHLPFSWCWRTRRADRRFVGLFDKIISVSQLHADAIQRELDVPPQCLVTIPNGVDTNRFSPSKLRGQNGVVVIGGAGNLTPVKRFDILIDAVAEVSREMPVELRIAGSGPEESALRQNAAKRGIQDKVQFVGVQRDMPVFLRSLDVFSMTSDNEGLPYAQLEAMATGLPSVVTDAGDLPLVVRDGTDGFVVPRDAPLCVADRLRRLVAEHRLRQNMGNNARQRACETYSQAAASEATGSVFRMLTSSNMPYSSYTDR